MSGFILALWLIGIWFSAVFMLGALIGMTFPDFYTHGLYRGRTLTALYIAWKVLLWPLYWIYIYLYGLWKGH